MPYDIIFADLATRHIDVEDDYQIRELADKYGVSAQSMTHRITNLLKL